MMLKYIGEVLGVKTGDMKPKLSEAEKWVDAGFVPGVGQIKTVEHNALPITVRVMIDQLQKEGKLNA